MPSSLTFRRLFVRLSGSNDLYVKPGICWLDVDFGKNTVIGNAQSIVAPTIKLEGPPEYEVFGRAIAMSPIETPTFGCLLELP